MGSTRILCVFVVLFALMRGGSAQDDLFLEQGTAGLHQSLKRLQTTASVLHVVAHPDDEDGALMCYCARGLGARAMLFCITRGEGGANLISSHFFDELGLLRTLEHLKAAQYYGSELFYSSAADYGYSKNLDEARRMWSDGRTILAELVEVIRREQPTIIMSRFRGDARDGHGHHQMSGVLSQEAFSAAADPRMFPDQLARGLTTWQAEKLYANNIRPQWREEDRDAWTVAVPTGQYDPVLGRSYAQIARFGLGFQRSQGISGHTSDAGQSTSYYRLVQVAADRTIPTHEQSLFDDLDTTIRAIGKLPGHTRPEELTAALTSIELDVQQAHDTFDLEQPENTIESLALALQETNALLDRIPALEMSSQQRALVQAHLIRNRNELNEAVALSAGVDLAAWATDDANDGAEGFNFATPGQRLVAHARVVVRNRVPARLLEISWQTAAGWTVQQPESPAADLNDNEALETQVQMQVDTAASATRPYWQRPSIREPFYSISGGEHRHRPLPPWPLHCVAKLTVNGTPVEVRRVVESRIGHTEFGNVRYAVQVVPPISLAFPLPYGIVPRDREQYTADVLVRSAVTGVAEGTLRLELPDGWSSEPVSHQFAFGKAGEETQFAFVLHRDRGAPAETTIQAVAEWNGKDYREGFVTVTARDLERANLFRPAVHQLRHGRCAIGGRTARGLHHRVWGRCRQRIADVGRAARDTFDRRFGGR